MSLYNLIKWTTIYRKATVNLCNYYKDKRNDPITEFKYKTNMIGKHQIMIMTIIQNMLKFFYF